MQNGLYVNYKIPPYIPGMNAGVLRLRLIMRHGYSETAVVGLSTTKGGGASLGFHFDDSRSIGQKFYFEDGTLFEVLALVPGDATRGIC